MDYTNILMVLCVGKIIIINVEQEFVFVDAAKRLKVW